VYLHPPFLFSRLKNPSTELRYICIKGKSGITDKDFRYSYYKYFVLVNHTPKKENKYKKRMENIPTEITKTKAFRLHISISRQLTWSHKDLSP
jgi:hypothetical protein